MGQSTLTSYWSAQYLQHLIGDIALSRKMLKKKKKSHTRPLVGVSWSVPDAASLFLSCFNSHVLMLINHHNASNLSTTTRLCDNQLCFVESDPGINKDKKESPSQRVSGQEMKIQETQKIQKQSVGTGWEQRWCKTYQNRKLKKMDRYDFHRVTNPTIAHKAI